MTHRKRLARLQKHLDKEGFAPKIRKGVGLMPSRPHNKVDKPCRCKKACDQDLS